MKASEHLEAVRSTMNNESCSPAEYRALEALEFLLEPLAEAEKPAKTWKESAKPNALTMGEAIHQDMADVLARVKEAREVAAMWEKLNSDDVKACGRRMLEILGRPRK